VLHLLYSTEQRTCSSACCVLGKKGSDFSCSGFAWSRQISPGLVSSSLSIESTTVTTPPLILSSLLARALNSFHLGIPSQENSASLEGRTRRTTLRTPFAPDHLNVTLSTFVRSTKPFVVDPKPRILALSPSNAREVACKHGFASTLWHRGSKYRRPTQANTTLALFVCRQKST
jgi:hypothetical protein